VTNSIWIGCLNLITSFDHFLKNKVKFANDSTLIEKGVGDVSIKGKNGVQSVIIGVIYIPGMKCNLLSIG
jgi:hypothetical protein